MFSYLINFKKNIRECLFKLEKNSHKCLVVVNDQKQLKGTVTDGDIRRALLRDANLDTKIIDYIKKKPVSIKIKNNFINDFEINKKVRDLLEIIKDDNIDLIPIINKKKQIIKIISTNDHKRIIKKNNKLANIAVLIMAGGRGSRLKQFTNYFPKPLVPVEDVTAVEYIINNFRNHGVKKFFMSVFYKKNLVKSYLKENNLNKIKFLEEKKPMGTAGALSMLKNKIQSDLFVINCDSILSIDLEKFYNFHKKNNFKITLVAASKNFKISYGACEINKNGQLKKINEKPDLNYLVSVGLYLVKPEVIKKVSNKDPLGMDTLIKKIKSQGGKIGVFPISENNWHDTGENQNKFVVSE